jgi:hypothetical protein
MIHRKLPCHVCHTRFSMTQISCDYFKVVLACQQVRAMICLLSVDSQALLHQSDHMAQREHRRLLNQVQAFQMRLV